LEERDIPIWDAPVPDWAVKPIETNTSHTEQENDAPNGNTHVGEQFPSGSDELEARSTFMERDEDAYMFVEEIASKEATSSEKRERMHSFYKVSSVPVYSNFKSTVVLILLHRSQQTRSLRKYVN
jgi:hypothetical protein